MSWRNNMRPASFRGAAFLVEDHTAEVGRRSFTHVYALRDEPFTEDLGRAPRRWAIEAFVLGPDYMAARDALTAALEAKGPGILVHPWLGRLSVSLDGQCTFRESTAEGGIAVFSLNFVESGENLSPSITEDTAEAARQAASGLGEAAGAAFSQVFSVASAPAFVTTAGADLLGQATAAVEQAVAGFAPALSTLGVLRAQAAGLLAEANGLLASPASAATSLLGLVGQVRALAGNPLAAVPALRSLMGFGSALDAVLGATTSRSRQRANQTALVALVRRAAAMELAIAISEASFDSYDQAAAIRTEAAEAIDVLATEAADAGEDDAYTALLAVRLAVIRDVAARGGSLARVFSYRPAQTLPAVLLAHRTYGDARRDAEIIARNRIRHPGFVPGGAPLEMLTVEAADGR